VREHGGLEYARNRADQFGGMAAEALLDLPTSESTEALQEAIAYVIERNN
jgi:octaprenyl-diphosphate synthase